MLKAIDAEIIEWKKWLNKTPDFHKHYHRKTYHVRAERDKDDGRLIEVCSICKKTLKKW